MMGIYFLYGIGAENWVKHGVTATSPPGNGILLQPLFSLTLCGNGELGLFKLLCILAVSDAFG